MYKIVPAERQEYSEETIKMCIRDRQKIVYAPDATMQAMLSDQQGRTLIVEPGIGWREGCLLYT